MSNSFMQLSSKTERDYLNRAIKLAGRGSSEVFPNPRVGALYVKDGRILGEGYHHALGRDHAEVEAGKNIDLEGASLYVSLEPCSHHGRTPPCAEFVARRGVKKVVFAMADPIHGGGAEMLRSSGVEVVGPVFCRDSLAILEPFCKNVISRRTYLTLKWAMTLDGRIATESGDSRWVTSKDARAHSHSLRCEVDGIMVGAGTLLADKPDLGVRHGYCGPAPRPIIWDPKGKTAECQDWYKGKKERSPVVITFSDNASLKWSPHAQVLFLDDWSLLDEALFQEGFHHVLVEGGGGLHGALLDHQLGDRVMTYIAPKIIGGAASKGPVAGLGRELMSEAKEAQGVKLTTLGEDILMDGLLKIYHPEGQGVFS
ncbi:MAG: bifunctional diaminohydroxyphosphoribosylaminopyrimidine deaminase/5-amino-6-(5-phosphoribosylamino)uracil reductase RibD [Planctomycetes bacterium]|nr:bifunctional diaminohydroxyphosphoribosylaminopyrimidine deaminase/5-amino-6-(5-phosphoribosylamino)uracil reductase RibD [Planctomycetota bacterium]